MDTGFSGLGSIMYGLVAAGLAVSLVAGGLVLSLSEAGVPLALLPSPAATSAALNQFVPSATQALPASPATPTPRATATATMTPTLTLPAQASPTSTVTATLTLTPTGCAPPRGWKPITISRGDTLNKLAQEYGTTAEELIEANCLVKSQLEPGATLYIPAEALPTPVSCGRPGGWSYTYVVQPGDTLFSISRRAGVSVAQIKQANCLRSDNIRVGQKLFLPVSMGPPRPPAPTPTEVEPTDPPPTNTPEVVERTPSPPDPP